MVFRIIYWVKKDIQPFLHAEQHPQVALYMRKERFHIKPIFWSIIFLTLAISRCGLTLGVESLKNPESTVGAQRKAIRFGQKYVTF